MTRSYDDLPVKVRRLNSGWFGEPWPSGICYDDDGRLIEEMRIEAPCGELCLFCDTPIVAGDQGTAMPHLGPTPTIRHVHKECILRMVLGSVSCATGEHQHDTRLTYRQEALELWDWVKLNGWPESGCAAPMST
jgi:hypothetical protein